MDIFIGRQPILNQNGDIYGYELLYRDSEVNRFPNICPEKATATVLVNAFLSIGIDRVAGGRLSFINFNETLLQQDFMTTLNPRQVVIEVLEDVKITKRLVERLKVLKKMGFRIALDDFILNEDHESNLELFRLVNIIKVDFLNSTNFQRAKIQKLVNRFPNIALLAEKVETEEQFKDAKSQGYRLFQGYFFAKPEILKSTDIPSNLTLYFHIMSEIKAEIPDIDKISGLVMRDVSLSYKLLRYINSLAFSVPNQVSSIRQAIMLMGTNEARKWLQVLILHDMGDGEGNGRIKALVDASLVRAKMCELLAKRKFKKNTDEYFLTGMFSLINVIMKRDWEDILPYLPLADTVRDTLLGGDTDITPYLKIAERLEDFSIDEANELATNIGVSVSDLSRYSLEVQRWVHQFDRIID